MKSSLEYQEGDKSKLKPAKKNTLCKRPILKGVAAGMRLRNATFCGYIRYNRTKPGASFKSSRLCMAATPLIS